MHAKTQGHTGETGKTKHWVFSLSAMKDDERKLEVASTGSVFYLENAHDKTHKHTLSPTFKTAVFADPTLSNHLTSLFFADSYNYLANTTGNAVAGSRWRKSPAGAGGREEAVGIITTLMEYINQGDDPMWRLHGSFFFFLFDRGLLGVTTGSADQYGALPSC